MGRHRGQHGQPGDHRHRRQPDPGGRRLTCPPRDPASARPGPVPGGSAHGKANADMPGNPAIRQTAPFLPSGRPAANQICSLLPGRNYKTRAAVNCRDLYQGSAGTWPYAWPGVVTLSWRPRAMAGYSAWLLTLTAAYSVFPGLRALAWALIGGSAAAAIVAGVVRHRPARGEPWLLLAGGCAILAAGQTGFLIISGAPRASVPFPWIADGCCLAACPLSVAGLAIFLRWRAAGRAVRGVLDALLLTACCAFAWWLWLVLGRGTGPVTVNRGFAAAFPLCDVLILAVAARVLATRPAPARPAWLLLLGAAGLGAADLAYALAQLHGGPGAALPIPLGWALCYAAWGAAAAAFPAAAALEEIAAAAQAATGAVAGRHPLQSLLALRSGATLRPVRPAPGGAAAPGGPRPVAGLAAGQYEQAMSTWLAAPGEPRPVLLPAGPGDGAAGAWADQQGVLLCPLPARDGRPPGVLAVFGEALSLAARAGILEVIAGLAARAAEQVTAAAEASREDARAYVRAVVQDSSDAILIVKDDGVVA